MGKLFLVSTPIGNLEDITLRAIKILSEVDIIACEDTRKTGLFLTKLRINTSHTSSHTRSDLEPGQTWFRQKRLISYYEENEAKRIPEIVQLLKEGRNVALVSNAGTPTISDPGFKMVRECVNQGIPVEAIPGPSAILTALVVSGLPTDKFLFLGYLPKKEGKKKNLLQSISNQQYNNLTIIFYESPYRLLATLTDLKDVLGDINIVICRELTKIHEEVRREKISESLKHFGEVKPKGELTILLNA